MGINYEVLVPKVDVTSPTVFVASRDDGTLRVFSDRAKAVEWAGGSGDVAPAFDDDPPSVWLHICKSFRIFRAYRSWEVADFGLDGIEKLDSWADWQRLLDRPGVLIVDEYGDRHEIAWFLELVQEAIGRAPKDYEDHVAAVQRQWAGRGGGMLDNDYMDPATGLHFYCGEFS